MKVNDIRPDNLEKNQLLAEAMDIKWLSDRKKEFVNVLCPACESDSFIKLYEKKSIDQVKCSNCDTQYANPRPSKKTLKEFYLYSKNYEFFEEYIYPVTKENRRTNLFQPRAKKTIEYAKKLNFKNGILLEIGSAYGIYCEEIKKCNFFDKVIGIEPTPSLSNISRKNGLDVIEKTYEEVNLDFKVDVIAHFEVIEHLFNPKHFLDWCNNNLNPGGFMITTCPNIKGLEPMVLGRHSNSIDHEHINMFSPSSLSLLLKRSNFDIIDINTPGSLDIDLIQRSVSEKKIGIDSIDGVLRELMFNSNQDIQKKFLTLLQEAKLTGNMMTISRKKD